jgi:hypothetical protein
MPKARRWIGRDASNHLPTNVQLSERGPRTPDPCIGQRRDTGVLTAMAG